MANPVLIGSSVPAGLEQMQLHKKLKLGNIVLTLLPADREEALAVARYCRENKIHLCFSELVHRGSYEVGWPVRKKMQRREFWSKAELDGVLDAAGNYYFGRMTIGEAGGVLYWPKAYTINRRADNWQNLPFVRTMAEAKTAYVRYLRQFIDFERAELSTGRLMNVDSSLVFKYHVEAGIDILCLEVMPGGPHIMHAAIRGTARAFQKPWGTHIAMQCYGGMSFDELWQKRWKTSVFYSYITGAQFIYPESGHYGYDHPARGQKFGFAHKRVKRVRAVVREAYQFARIHTRPPIGPRAGIGVLHGNLDGAPGLWNRYAWGQYRGRKWIEGPPERGWRLVDKFHRKEDWPRETVQGEMDFSGNPPYGQYDVVPVEASPDVLKSYSCLTCLGWNTITPAIYRKLKAYVKGGGHLVMYLAHLSTHTDRAKDLRLFRKGDFADLFGVRILGKGKTDVMGIKCGAESSLKSYRLPFWRINTDPRFMGKMTPAKVKVTTARVLCGFSDFYNGTRAELERRPALVENSLGKGKAFLVTAWEYPADEGLVRFTDDLLRVILAGEQGDIRLLSSDRIRYAVYDGRLPTSRRKYNVIYLLNTDPDCPYPARLWIRGRTTRFIDVPANSLRIVYRVGDLVLTPWDKCVDVKGWEVNGTRHTVDLFSASPQTLEVHNVGKRRLLGSVNGGAFACSPGACVLVKIKQHVDSSRNEFFAPDFLEEPRVRWKHAGLPY